MRSAYRCNAVHADHLWAWPLIPWKGWEVSKEIEKEPEIWTLIAIGYTGTSEEAWNLARNFATESLSGDKRVRITVAKKGE